MPHVKNRFASYPFLVMACLYALLAVGAGAVQLERYVWDGGTHDYPYTNWTTAATNLKVAVDAANANDARDIVWVRDGHYMLDETVLVGNTELRGWSGNPDNAVVDGNAGVGCFVLEHTNARLSGLTVTNGFLDVEHGAGVIVDADWIVISNCVITGNNAGASRSGLYINGSDVKILDTRIVGNTDYGCYTAAYNDDILFEGCTVSHNSSDGIRFARGTRQVISRSRLEYNGGYGAYHADYGTMLVTDSIIGRNQGAGLGKRYTSMTVVNCIIEHNTNSGYYGGGLYVRGAALAVVSNCVVRGNSANNVGGALAGYQANSRGVFYNTLMVGNRAPTAGGAVSIQAGRTNEYYNCTIAYNVSPTALSGGDHLLYNTIVYYNPCSTTEFEFHYSCATGLVGNANITSAPDFRDDTDPVYGDYSLSPGSPCINAGTNFPWMFAPDAVDLAGNPRIDAMHRQVDIGAYEFMYPGTLLQLMGGH